MICDWLLTDDRIASALQARKDALLGLPVTFEPGGNLRRSAKAVKALDAEEDWWYSFPEAELSQMLVWGLLLGVAPMRHRWTERRGRLLPCPEFWNPYSLRFDDRLQRWTIRDQDSRDLVVVPGDGTWVLHLPFGEKRPWAYGLWRPLWKLALIKQFAEEDWARFGEKASSLIGTTPEGSTQTERQQLAESLSRIGSQAVAVLGAGEDAKLLSSTANTKDIYDAQIERSNEGIAVLIRGGNLSSVTTGGSLAAAESQAKTGDGAKLKFDGQTMSTTINWQSLNWWADFNYGDPALAPWPMWKPPDDGQQVYKYHLDYGILTKNEVRGKLGFAPVPDGDVPATPVAGAPGDSAAQGASLRDGHHHGEVLLQSGDRVPADSGLALGQAYADVLTEKGTDLANAMLAPAKERILSAIQGATSFEDLKQRLLDDYRLSDPAQVIELMERMLVMAELAGHYGVQKDA
jgi:phage gp29-like protein